DPVVPHRPDVAGVHGGHAPDGSDAVDLLPHPGRPAVGGAQHGGVVGAAATSADGPAVQGVGKGDIERVEDAPSLPSLAAVISGDDAVGAARPAVLEIDEVDRVVLGLGGGIGVDVLGDPGCAAVRRGQDDVNGADDPPVPGV